MNMNEFLEERKSIRDFKNKKLTTKDIEKIETIINKTNEMSEKYHVTYKFYANGNEVYEMLDGKAGYGGLMIDAPAYIAMQQLTEDKDSYIFGAYYLESIITELEKLDLGTCWITVSKVSDTDVHEIFSGSQGHVDFLLGVGYPASEFSFGKQQFSSRIGVEDFVFIDNFDTPIEMQTLESYGLDELFSYLRFAPSTKNEQPWRFLITNSEIKLYIENFKGNQNYVDAGIVMYYYTQLAASIGIHAIWESDDQPDVGNLKYIAHVNY